MTGGSHIDGFGDYDKPSEDTPGPDHAAQPDRWWNSLPVRTAVQGIAIDTGLAVCLVVYDALGTGDPDWRLLGLAVVKTGLQTVASSVMKRLRPPAGLRQ